MTPKASAAFTLSLASIIWLNSVVAETTREKTPSLDGLVGTWQRTSFRPFDMGDFRQEVSFAWTLGDQFLIGEYRDEPGGFGKGMHVVGWDPEESEIIRWDFPSGNSWDVVRTALKNEGFYGETGSPKRPIPGFSISTEYMPVRGRLQNLPSLVGRWVSGGRTPENDRREMVSILVPPGCSFLSVDVINSEDNDVICKMFTSFWGGQVASWSFNAKGDIRKATWTNHSKKGVLHWRSTVMGTTAAGVRIAEESDIVQPDPATLVYTVCNRFIDGISQPGYTVTMKKVERGR